MKKFRVVIFIVILSYIKLNAQIYVSTTGDDTNSGTIDFPLKSIPIAISKIQLGDTIYVRGGVYTLTTKISISKNANENSKYYLFAYKDERPILDFSSMPINSTNRGINLSGSYWYIKGIDIKGAGDNGMNISGSNNTIEFCSFYENHDTGLQLGGGASNNKIINCDSYYNVDPGQGNADGFAPKLDVGTNNYFYGCRSWQNSDDGWDGYLRGANNITTVLENCWCFDNGYLKDGSASTGNGNGFKMGGSDLKDLEHNFIIKDCIAFDNRVKGFDQNNNRGSMTIYNCSAYRNGTNYSITLSLDSGKTATLINDVALGNYGSLASFVIQETNSWMSPFTVTNADFISTDTLGVRAPRKTDGSLPDIDFLHLAAGSDLIDAGTPVGLPYNDSAPDLGAFETPGIPSGVAKTEIKLDGFKLYQNYPNPFNPSTNFIFSLSNAGKVSLEIYDVLGNKINTIINDYLNSGQYEITWNANDGNGKSLSSGIYFALLQFQNKSQTIKLMYLK